MILSRFLVRLSPSAPPLVPRQGTDPMGRLLAALALPLTGIFEFAIILFSQASDMTVGAGAAGWAGTGILGGVLSWLLFKQIPEQTRILREIIKQHDDTEKAQRDAHVILEREQREDFKQTMQAMMEHSRSIVDGLGKALQADLRTMQKSMETMLEVLHKGRRP